MPENVKIFKSIELVAKSVCDKLFIMSHNCKEGEYAHIALSGGSTPKVIFQMLLHEYLDKINWETLHFWWGDERHVPLESLESNAGEAKRILFDHINDFPQQNLHPINTELNPEQSCLNYVQEMKKHIKFQEGLPKFNLILLGLGSDGHTASLFPNDVSIDCETWTAIGTQPETHQTRITLSYKLINHAEEIIFIVTGDSKEEVVNNLFNDKHKAMRYPAFYIQPKNKNLIWYMDETAAKAILKESSQS